MVGMKMILPSPGKLMALNCTLFAPSRGLPFRHGHLPRFPIPTVSMNEFMLPRWFASKPPPEIFALNKRISHLVRTGLLAEARVLFDSSSQRNTITWNSMITGYVKSGEISKARDLFDEMPTRDVTSWNVMILGYTRSHRGVHGFVDEARAMFEQMPERDHVSWNTMISAYARIGRMDEALKLFQAMPDRTVVSWNAMVSGFLWNADMARAVELYEQMPERDSASLSAIISGLVQNNKLDEAAGILEKYGSKICWKKGLVHAYDTLVAGYAQRGQVKEARALFDVIPKGEKNVVSWNTMIMGYTRVGDIESARRLFDEMTERDTFSWNTMISGYVHNRSMENASNLFCGMPEPDILTWNLMVSGYAESGNLWLALDLFKRMPKKNLVSWNTMIAAYGTNNDFKGAIDLFIRMLVEGEKPDRHTLSSVLAACTGLVDLHLGLQIHQMVVKTVIPDLPINNSLITMYSRCGAISEALLLFNEVKAYKDFISWNAMIGGYASHGLAVEALELFELMKRIGVKPTYITFISILNACAHSGLVEEGRGHFQSMTQEYGIEPRVEHFAALVDLLGRQGQLEEAMEVIESMAMEPDKAVWGALIGACRMHNNIELAWVAAEALMRIEPDSSAPYVLLYNMYADVGQWDEATKVREVMEKHDIRKHTGHSRVGSL
ncbi:hypothetical protein SAY86_020455 [Trapa natans]|uniref:Pentatricopeptide repeat-containing protein n=1 Tax=Trapa natans TaxID=22666 RepID=A0AAN7R6J2_TRANT|nr:hypothetical protein SAY86_020455 [Trapa natans]